MPQKMLLKSLIPSLDYFGILLGFWWCGELQPKQKLVRPWLMSMQIEIEKLFDNLMLHHLKDAAQLILILWGSMIASYSN